MEGRVGSWVVTLLYLRRHCHSERRNAAMFVTSGMPCSGKALTGLRQSNCKPLINSDNVENRKSLHPGVYNTVRRSKDSDVLSCCGERSGRLGRGYAETNGMVEQGAIQYATPSVSTCSMCPV